MFETKVRGTSPNPQMFRNQGRGTPKGINIMYNGSGREILFALWCSWNHDVLVHLQKQKTTAEMLLPLLWTSMNNMIVLCDEYDFLYICEKRTRRKYCGLIYDLFQNTMFWIKSWFPLYFREKIKTYTVEDSLPPLWLHNKKVWCSCTFETEEQKQRLRWICCCLFNDVW